MPKRKQDYEADDGFVEDAPQGKKGRSSGTEVKRNEGKTLVSTDVHTDDDGNEYWEISRTRRVQISTFKGATMVNIREFYEKDGKSLPGKKGISLSIDQFTAVLDILPDIEGALASKGIAIPRPKYDGAVRGAAADEEDVDGEEEAKAQAEAQAGEEQDEKPQRSSRLDKFKMNHEETSDEDGG